MRRTTYQVPTLLTVALIGCCILSAKDKHQKDATPHDQIVVESQIPNADGPVTRFVATRHYNRSYIYAEREAGKPVKNRQ
jgi:hypothetical protein